MKTQSALELFQYWNRLRNGTTAPSRADIEPSDIRNVLANTFILEAPHAAGDFVFRISGTNIGNLFGRELRGTLLRALFQDKHRPIVSRLMRNCHQDGLVVLLGLDATTQTGRATPLELLMLPLNDEKEGPRILGCLSPYQYQFWHGLEALDRIDLHTMRIIDTAREPLFLNNRPQIELHPTLMPEEDQLLASFAAPKNREPQLTVIQGGKTALAQPPHTKR